MLYDNVVCNELVACACVCIPLVCMYIYNKINKKNKYSSVRDFLKHTDRVVHIVVDKTTIQPRTRIRMVCIELVNGKEVPRYMHEHNL